MKTGFKKKGELSTQQIIMIIILIASFIVVLYFLIKLNLGNESVQEVCHNSVTLRASAALPADSTPLKCYTDYVCLTKNGDCGDMVNPAIEKVKTEDEVYHALAEQMANCWWMFGEGKVDYIGSKILQQNYCSICSQLYLDNSLKDINSFSDGQISKDKLYDYLAANEYTQGKTYAQFLFGTNDISGLKQQIVKSDNNTLGVGTFGNISIGKRYFVVMGITSEIGNTYKWIGIGIAGLAFLTPVGWVGGAILVGSGVGVAAAGGTVAGLFQPEIAAIVVQGKGIDNRFMAPTIQEANSDKFNALNCKDVLTLG